MCFPFEAKCVIGVHHHQLLTATRIGDFALATPLLYIYPATQAKITRRQTVTQHNKTKFPMSTDSRPAGGLKQEWKPKQHN
jgi:hypothetical protein